MFDLLSELCSTMGVSGNEAPIANLCAKKFSKYCDTRIDNNGSVIARLNHYAENTILLDAHIDRIGLVVTDIDENGFVKVDKCGGIDLRTLLDTRVVLQKNPKIVGTICCMPPHLSDGNEDKAEKMSKIWVDFAMLYKKVIDEIEIGDELTFATVPRKLLNNRVSAAAVDDRCSVAALYRCAEILSKEKSLKYNVVFLLSVQEETFETGAKTGAFSISPDEAIAVDVSFSSQPDISGQYSNIDLDKGPMISFSSVMNKDMSNKLVKVAKENNIDFQYEALPVSTGTNADSIATTKSGVKSCVVSIPLRNMHTPNEIVALNDIENTAMLISKYIISGGVDDD